MPSPVPRHVHLTLALGSVPVPGLAHAAHPRSHPHVHMFERMLLPSPDWGSAPGMCAGAHVAAMWTHVWHAGLADVYRVKTPYQCLRSQSFWLLLVANGIGTGSGLTLLNNLSQQARPQAPLSWLTSNPSYQRQQQSAAARSPACAACAALPASAHVWPWPCMASIPAEQCPVW